MLIAWIRAAKTLTSVQHGAARSWRFAKVVHAGPVVLHAPPGMEALAHDAGLLNVRQLKADDGGGKGFALYGIDLSH